jgi:hypothetical protein
MIRLEVGSDEHLYDLNISLHHTAYYAEIYSFYDRSDRQRSLLH